MLRWFAKKSFLHPGEDNATTGSLDTLMRNFRFDARQNLWENNSERAHAGSLAPTKPTSTSPTMTSPKNGNDDKVELADAEPNNVGLTHPPPPPSSTTGHNDALNLVSVIFCVSPLTNSFLAA